MQRLTLGLILLVAGCGDKGTTDDMMSTEDMSAAMDLTMPSGDMTMAPNYDLTYFHEVDGSGPACGNTTTCSPGQFCCVSGSGASCEASCGDAGLAVQCSGPAQCGGNPCCLTLQGTTPQDISCTSSASACPAMFQLTGGGTNQTRACKYDGDCTAGLSGTQMYPDCCHVVQQPNIKFCFSKAFVSFTMGQLACP
jgi:hypothetical protein